MYKNIAYAPIICLLLLILIDVFTKQRKYVDFSPIVLVYFILLLTLYIITKEPLRNQILNVKTIYISMVLFLVLLFILAHQYPIQTKIKPWETPYIAFVLLFAWLFLDNIQDKDFLSFFFLATTFIYSLLKTIGQMRGS